MMMLDIKFKIDILLVQMSYLFYYGCQVLLKGKMLKLTI